MGANCNSYVSSVALETGYANLSAVTVASSRVLVLQCLHIKETNAAFHPPPSVVRGIPLFSSVMGKNLA